MSWPTRICPGATCVRGCATDLASAELHWPLNTKIQSGSSLPAHGSVVFSGFVRHDFVRVKVFVSRLCVVVRARAGSRQTDVIFGSLPRVCSARCPTFRTTCLPSFWRRSNRAGLERSVGHFYAEGVNTRVTSRQYVGDLFWKKGHLLVTSLLLAVVAAVTSQSCGYGRGVCGFFVCVFDHTKINICKSRVGQPRY